MTKAVTESAASAAGMADASNDDAEQEHLQDAEGADETEGGEDDEQQGDGQAEQTAEADGDEVVVTIGEESPTSEHDEQRAPEWVRELRKTNREQARRIRELEAAQAAQAGGKPLALGDKPTLESCDFDAERFESELLAWNSRKAEVERQAKERKEAEERAQAEWQARLQSYSQAKAGLKVRDFDDAEEHVKATLSVTQQGVILHGAERPELIVYALGKNPAKAKELASIDDPVKFAFAVAKLETQLKVTPRKAAPLPERTVRGGAPATTAVDSQLERLRIEADKTGDYSKVAAYKRQLRERKAA